MEVSKLAIQKFMYTGLVAAVAAPMVLASFSSVIDTPWGVALNRAVKVPLLLCSPFTISGGRSPSSHEPCQAMLNHARAWHHCQPAHPCCNRSMACVRRMC